MSHNIKQLQKVIETLKCQSTTLEAAIADAKQRQEMPIKDANAKLAELQAALKWAKQDMVRQLLEYQELMIVSVDALIIGIKITTYCKLLGGKESRLESGIQHLSIHTKITNGYSGGLSSAKGDSLASLDLASGIE